MPQPTPKTNFYIPAPSSAIDNFLYMRVIKEDVYQHWSCGYISSISHSKETSHNNICPALHISGGTCKSNPETGTHICMCHSLLSNPSIQWFPAWVMEYEEESDPVSALGVRDWQLACTRKSNFRDDCNGLDIPPNCVPARSRFTWENWYFIFHFISFT